MIDSSHRAPRTGSGADDPVLIVGGGWAGLATAVELCRHDIAVKLVEAARQLGGRARTVAIDGHTCDNGQHLMLGAFREMLALLRVIGADEHALFERRPLELQMSAHGRPDIRIALPRLAAPWHLVAGLQRARGLSLGDKTRLVRLCTALLFHRPSLTADISIGDWLERRGQSATLRRALWEPLCLATMNTPLHEASAYLFLRVIRDVFGRRSDDSDLLLTRTDLGAVFPDPARRYIAAHGGEILTGRRVTGLVIDGPAITGLVTGNERIDSSRVVLAVPPAMCRRLAAPHPALQPLAGTLARLREAPICTIYVRYPPDIRLPCPLLGLLDTTAQWVFDRARNGQPGLMAVVISGAGPHMALDRRTLANTVIGELATRFPDWPAPLGWHVIREKQATFVAHAGVSALRPPNRTAVDGLWIAGDYTATGYPATLEGAIRSGLEAARQIINSSEYRVESAE